jgi:DNA polymerase alpha subunit B
MIFFTQRIRLLPNPARFTINGISFGVTSVDVLFHLKREEFVKRGEEADSISPTSAEDTGSDVMGNLCRHLLQQRRFVVKISSGLFFKYA